eukprot:CAMPEP_0119010744 /NCGR_PEP_ID=MMETSP1176-20130426/5216_1 /TAXON_ID=265551 /ORGANISM="Synedropsis recta cf, Strain CCMP1620" /LENGTH=68 /DNA_ID=CAMNT_0006963465 /DNA_START=1905 /DNA_END=2111 /DNA_ORIENTATION=+
MVTEANKKRSSTTAIPDAPEDPPEVSQPHKFISAERHSKTTQEDLSERWGISITHAALTPLRKQRHRD